MSASAPYLARSVSAILARIRELSPVLPVGSAIEAWCLREDIAGVDAETTGAVAYAAVLSHCDPSVVADLEPLRSPPAPEVVQITLLPTKVWVESDLFGGRHVVLQHEGFEPFTYASFHYDWRYTSNSMTWSAAVQLALALGAVEPVESRMRPLPDGPSGTQFPVREAQG